ncbi:MAG: hypothetical protein GY780_13925 [bacterium]|nr:hypothetical protein [bacterium]
MSETEKEKQTEIEITDADAVDTQEILNCGQCQGLIPNGEEIRTENAVFCPGCFHEIQKILHDSIGEQSQNINYLGALSGGIIGGLITALLWWGFVTLTHFQIGIVAIIIGWGTGKGVAVFSGNKRSLGLQLMSIGLTLISYGMATYWVSRTFVHHYFAENSMAGTLPLFPTPALFMDVVGTGFQAFDLIFLGIALWQAWKITAPMKINTES